MIWVITSVLGDGDGTDLGPLGIAEELSTGKITEILAETLQISV